MNTRTLRLALLSAGLSLSAAAHAAEPPATDDTATGYFAGVKVAIDPATGRLRAPTAEEIRQLRTAAATTPAAAPASRGKRAPRNEAEARQTVRRHANGSGVMAEVPEDRMSALVATQTADGRIVLEHRPLDAAGVPVQLQPEVASE